jgi:hypothetical protein
MPIEGMSDSIIVPLPVYYGTSDTHYGRPVFPKTGLFYALPPPPEGSLLTKARGLS